MRMFALSAADLETAWADIEPLFDRFARETGEITSEQVREAASTSRLQIWGLQDDERVHMVAATEICRGAWGDVCVIRVACGNARVAMQERLLDEIGKWAHATGCDRVRLYGRPGWLRRFRRFRPIGVIGQWRLRMN